MNKIAFVVPLLVLAACGPSYHDSLDQMLRGKSPDERREILSRECARQADGPPERADPRYTSHAESMKRICAEYAERP